MGHRVKTASKLQTITLKCPGCKTEHDTVLTGHESAIYWRCDVCKRVVPYVVCLGVPG
jgi:transposase-like protein